MEKQNENQANVQSNDLSNLKNMFSDYRKKAAPAKRRTGAEILAKYFVPRNTKEVYRILPPKQGRKHIEEAFFHVVPTLTAGGKKKYNTVIYCPAHNDPKVPKLDGNGQPELDVNGQPRLIPAPCPLCSKAKAILSKQDPSLKGVKKEQMNEAQKIVFEKNKEIFKDANQWEAKKFYIVRGIDKGAEKDGVKFWRFKHNFKNQGTLDKLLPILEEYMSVHQADFSDPNNGTDLSIIMTDSEFNGRVYKAISAITYRGKSPLHSDPIVARQWLEDDITWRDVFKPKQAPGMPPYEFLEAVANGVNPYWDDSDANNKHWVFPGRPDLEAAANTRTRNLDADDDDNFEQASDIDDEEYPRVTISNITESKVGTYTDNAVDVGQSVLDGGDDEDNSNDEPEDGDASSSGDYDDLPF
jgi:hypothetical protein